LIFLKINFYNNENAFQIFFRIKEDEIFGQTLDRLKIFIILKLKGKI